QAEWDLSPSDGDPLELEFIYQEYNGSSWGNLVRFSPRDIRSDFHYTATPNHGHWHEGIGLIDDGTSVYFIAQLGFLVNETDFPIFWKLKSDGTAFEDIAANYYSREYESYSVSSGFSGEWGWTTNQIGCIVAGKPIIACATSDSWDLGMYVVSLGENGDGVGWQKAKDNVDL